MSPKAHKPVPACLVNMQDLLDWCDAMNAVPGYYVISRRFCACPCVVLCRRYAQHTSLQPLDHPFLLRFHLVQESCSVCTFARMCMCTAKFGFWWCEVDLQSKCCELKATAKYLQWFFVRIHIHMQSPLKFVVPNEVLCTDFILFVSKGWPLTFCTGKFGFKMIGATRSVHLFWKTLSRPICTQINVGSTIPISCRDCIWGLVKPFCTHPNHSKSTCWA